MGLLTAYLLGRG